MAEFLESFALCAFAVTFFLGGWQAPTVLWWGGWRPLVIPCWTVALAGAGLLVTARRLPRPLKLSGLAVVATATVWWGAAPIPSWAWFLAKTYALVAVLVWLRGTFPRLRVDQLMGLAWKFFLPLALLNILATGLWAWYPFPTGTAASALLLGLGIWGLVRVNQPAPLQPRTYVLAE
jgi:NADH:ubiquinone oxidoreductase subunit H